MEDDWNEDPWSRPENDPWSLAPCAPTGASWHVAGLAEWVAQMRLEAHLAAIEAWALQVGASSVQDRLCEGLPFLPPGGGRAQSRVGCGAAVAAPGSQEASLCELP